MLTPQVWLFLSTGLWLPLLLEGKEGDTGEKWGRFQGARTAQQAGPGRKGPANCKETPRMLPFLQCFQGPVWRLSCSWFWNPQKFNSSVHHSCFCLYIWIKHVPPLTTKFFPLYNSSFALFPLDFVRLYLDSQKWWLYQYHLVGRDWKANQVKYNDLKINLPRKLSDEKFLNMFCLSKGKVDLDLTWTDQNKDKQRGGSHPLVDAIG